jgi:hypothetical protein
MHDIRLTRTRRNTPSAGAPSPVSVDLAWPPTAEDLDAIAVVDVEMRRNTAVQAAAATRPASPATTLLTEYDDRGDVDDWAFAAPSAVTASAPVERRGQRRTRHALLAVASIAATVSLWYLGLPFMDLRVDVPTQHATRAPLPAVPVQASLGSSPAATAAAVPSASALPAPAPDVSDRPAPFVAPATGSADATDQAPEPASPARPPMATPMSQVYAARGAEPVGAPTPDTTRPSSSIPNPTSLALASLPSLAAVVPATTTTAVVEGPVPTAATSEVDETVRRASMPAARPAKTDEMDVQSALRRYERAYGQLDARAAQAVWPSVDVQALARAFQGLESQALEFDRCELAVQGAVASADCLGRATYVRRVGSKAPRTEARAWNFRLRKVDGDWQILRAEMR